MHLLINIPARDIDILILTPFSLNTDLQLFLAPYPEELTFSPLSQSSNFLLGMQSYRLRSGYDHQSARRREEGKLSMFYSHSHNYHFHPCHVIITPISSMFNTLFP